MTPERPQQSTQSERYATPADRAAYQAGKQARMNGGPRRAPWRAHGSWHVAWLDGWDWMDGALVKHAEAAKYAEREGKADG